MGSVRKERRSVIALGIVLTGVVLVWGPVAYALDPALEISQYAPTSAFALR